MDTVLQTVISNSLCAMLLAVPAAAVSYGLRRPALAHGLWLLVLLKLVTPPLWNVAITLPTFASTASIAEPAAAELMAVSATLEDLPALEDLPLVDPTEERSPAAKEELSTALVANDEPSPVASSLLVDAPAPEPPLSVTIDWQSTLLFFWMAGSASWALLLVVRLERFQRLLRCATLAPDWLQDEAERLAEKLGLRICPTVWLVPGRVSPMLWSSGLAPRLVLPAKLLKRLDVSGRQALLIHELAHYRRGDHWLRWFEMAVSVLFWWHPVVWWARHELQEAEEQCCDAWVVWALPGMARSYATALVETVDFLAGASPVLPPVASGIGYIHDLKRRLTMIMRGTPPRAMTWSGLAGLFGLGAILLPLVPTWAQDRGGQPPADERRREQPRNEDPRSRREAREGDGRQDEAAKLEAEIRKMSEQVEAMMQQVQKAQARLQELRGGPRPGGGPATGRGAPTGSFPGGPGAGGFGTGGAPGAGGPVGPGPGGPGVPGAGGLGGPGAVPPPGAPGAAMGRGMPGAGMGPGGRMMPGPGGPGMMGGGSPPSIEQRLEMIERTLAEIRQEMRQGQGGRPGGGGGRGRGPGGDNIAPPAERRRTPDAGGAPAATPPRDDATGGPGDFRRPETPGRFGGNPPSPPSPPATPGRGDERRPGENSRTDTPPAPATPAPPGRPGAGRLPADAPTPPPAPRGGADRPAESGR